MTTVDDRAEAAIAGRSGWWTPTRAGRLFDKDGRAMLRIARAAGLRVRRLPGCKPEIWGPDVEQLAREHAAPKDEPVGATA